MMDQRPEADTRDAGQCRNCLLSIPLSILTDILTEWIVVRDLCRVDWATSGSSRKALHALFSQEGFLVDVCMENMPATAMAGYLKWRIIRLIKARSFRLDWNQRGYELGMILSDLVKFFRLTGERLSTIELSFTGEDSAPFSVLVASHCSNLSHLALDECCLDGLDAITHSCGRLHTLTIENCTAHYPMPMAMDCPQLRVLRVIGSEGVSIPALVSNAPHLTELWLTNTDATDSLEELRTELQELKVLYVERCPRASDNALVHTAQYCPNIDTLELRDCQLRIADVTLQAFAAHCPRISTLRVAGRFTVAALTAVASRVTLLHLDVSVAGDADIQEWQVLAQRCCSLKSLRLCVPTGMPVVITCMVKHATQLQQLAVQSMPVGDHDLSALVESNSATLTDFCLLRCQGYSHAGILKVIDGCPHLRRVQVGSGDAVVTPLVRELWMRLRPGLVIVNKEGR